MRVPLPLLLAGCVHLPPASLPPGRTVVYDVAVVTASGDRTVTALYALEATHRGGRTWTIRTLHTAGSVEAGDTTWSFDSEAPSPADPWPLLLQHAVASVPAGVRFDARGAPEALVDADGWAQEARDAVEALGLPPGAKAAGDQLLDPSGLLADLRRTLPGTPPDGEWARAEHLAGLEAVRVETCATLDERAWTCAGTVAGPEGGAWHLHDATSTTAVVTDADGLVSHESAWSGTLLWLEGEDVRDVPVAGQRLVRRR